jgi:hypothetical protein
LFEPTSRYYSLENVTMTMPDGRVITYKPRRILPDFEVLQTLAEVEVTDGDRIDLITARTLGDPEQFWRVCDANDALSPFELVAEAGRRVRVPVPRI